MTEYTAADLHAKVGDALRDFFCKDACLLHLKVNERSITHKLAEHLQHQFDDLTVDCEYNRDGYDPKRLNWGHETTRKDCTHAKTVYPDIIVHKRGFDTRNMLVIEVKKSGGDDSSRDKKKLSAFTVPKPEGEYGYRFGLYLEFEVGKRSGLKRAECYRDGEKVEPCCCRGSLVDKFGSTPPDRRSDH